MLYEFVGKEAFFKGVSIYLTKHKHKNTVTEDLWNAISEASGATLTCFSLYLCHNVNAFRGEYQGCDGQVG